MGHDLGDAVSLEQDAAHDAQEMGERQHLADRLGPARHAAWRTHTGTIPERRPAYMKFCRAPIGLRFRNNSSTSESIRSSGYKLNHKFPDRDINHVGNVCIILCVAAAKKLK